jgi:hypothetical protein
MYVSLDRNFTRVTRGPETGAYYHPLFQKDDLRLAQQMTCINSRSPQQLHSMDPVALGIGQNTNSGDAQSALQGATGSGTMVMLPGTNIGMIGPSEPKNQSIAMTSQEQQQQDQQKQLMAFQQLQQQHYVPQLSQPTGSSNASTKSSEGSAVIVGNMVPQNTISGENNLLQQQHYNHQQQNHQQATQFNMQLQMMQSQQIDMNAVVMNAFSQQQQQYCAMFLSQQQQMSAMNTAMGVQIQQQQNQLQFLQNQNQQLCVQQQQQQHQQQVESVMKSTQQQQGQVAMESMQMQQFQSSCPPAVQHIQQGYLSTQQEGIGPHNSSFMVQQVDGQVSLNQQRQGSQMYHNQETPQSVNHPRQNTAPN